MGVANLGGMTRGRAPDNTIWLHNNAAGWGWHVEPPYSDSEFTTRGNKAVEEIFGVQLLHSSLFPEVMGFQKETLHPTFIIPPEN